MSLFDRIVSSCVKITQGKIVTLPASSSGLMSMAASVTGMDSRAENLKFGQKLKYRALSILVSIVHSLLEWAKEYPCKIGKNQSPLIYAKEFQKIFVSETPVTLVKNPLGIIRMTSVFYFTFLFQESCRFHLPDSSK